MELDEVEMTPTEVLELRFNALSESLDRLRREIHETQRNMTDLQASMRLEHSGFREDCNELFEMVRTIERSQRQDVSELTRGYRDVIDDGALDRVPGWEAA